MAVSFMRWDLRGCQKAVDRISNIQADSEAWVGGRKTRPSHTLRQHTNKTQDLQSTCLRGSSWLWSFCE